MKAYRIEIFDTDMNYKSSYQTDEIKYTFDYLDIEKNKISVAKIKAEKGDYIRIKQGKAEYNGIVSDVVVKKDLYEITYKPFAKLFDVKIYVNPEALKNSYIEKWIAGMISATYINGADTMQNIKGIEITVQTLTEGTVDYEKGIKNLYDVILGAFTEHGIVCNFKINPQKKKIELQIGKNTLPKFVIEAGLPNIIEKEITIKEAKESINKLTIYNDATFNQSSIFYKNKKDEITTEETNRVYPVVFDSVAIKVSGNKTFEEMALAKATATLKASKYDNLIEITTLNNDSLVRPKEREIGQEAVIMSEGVEYHTILTAIEIEDYTKLIFGAIRLELTKMLKRRWRKDD